MRVAACIVTRGNVDLTEVIKSIPEDWEVVVWDNSKRPNDLAVYGRYAAIWDTDAEIIYVQDDDAVLEPEGFDTLLAAYQPNAVTANMPARFRHDFYQEHCLVGFGAIFHRSLPALAFERFLVRYSAMWNQKQPRFLRLCDIIFTGLTPRHLVDVPHRDLPWASDPDRMWKQPNHQAERSEMLELVRKVRDA